MNDENKNVKIGGTFASMLKRSNSKIRDDRADAILRKAETQYRRQVEDLNDVLIDLAAERDNMLDLSPTSADSLKLASDFDAGVFIDDDIKIGIKVREVEIKLEIAQNRYQELFGKKLNLSK